MANKCHGLDSICLRLLKWVTGVTRGFVVDDMDNVKCCHIILCVVTWSMCSRILTKRASYGCILWIQNMICTLHQLLQWSIQYHGTLNRVIWALDCTIYMNLSNVCQLYFNRSHKVLNAKMQVKYVLRSEKCRINDVNRMRPFKVFCLGEGNTKIRLI